MNWCKTKNSAYNSQSLWIPFVNCRFEWAYAKFSQPLFQWKNDKGTKG